MTSPVTFRRRRHSDVAPSPLRSQDSFPSLGGVLGNLQPWPTSLSPPATRGVSAGELDPEASSELEAVRPGASGEVAVKVLVRCRPLLDASKERVSINVEKSNSQGQVTLSFSSPSPTDGAGVGRPARSPSRRESASRSYRCNAFGPESYTQEEIFAHASPIIDRVMEGYNGTVFCYGITGSGKTYTISGPTKARDSPACDPEQNGIVQRTAWRMFEYISQHTAQEGETFAVEVSFLEIYSGDGVRETLVDLLAEEKDPKSVEVKQDRSNTECFIPEGLRRVPIRTPDEMCKVLEDGRQRCTYMETTRNVFSSRSHCLFIVTVECAADLKGAEPMVKRGKLVLVDLAGSESIKKVMAASANEEDLRRRQAIGINRVLSHLGSVVNNLNIGIANGAGYRNTALTMLLRDCLGGSARALLIANIGPEAEWSSETYMTLTFAQQMMQVRNVEKATVIEGKESMLMQMRSRHLECIKRLQEKSDADVTPKEREERKLLQKELEDLDQKMLTKSKATETLESLKAEHKRKMEELQREMTGNLQQELDKVQAETVNKLESLQKALESKATMSTEKMAAYANERHEERTKSIELQINHSVEAKRTAEGDVSSLRVQLAAAEERVQMLQELQQDFARERAELNQEMRDLHKQAGDQYQKLALLEGEMQQYRAEASVQQAEVERVQIISSDECEAFCKEREEWERRKAELNETKSSTAAAVQSHSACAKTNLEEAEARHLAEMSELRTEIDRLKKDAAEQQSQLDGILQFQVHLKADVEAERDKEADLRKSMQQEIHEHEDRIERANLNIKELMNMLGEVQHSIITATNKTGSREY